MSFFKINCFFINFPCVFLLTQPLLIHHSLLFSHLTWLCAHTCHSVQHCCHSPMTLLPTAQLLNRSSHGWLYPGFVWETEIEWGGERGGEREREREQSYKWNKKQKGNGIPRHTPNWEPKLAIVWLLRNKCAHLCTSRTHVWTCGLCERQLMAKVADSCQCPQTPNGGRVLVSVNSPLRLCP